MNNLQKDTILTLLKTDKMNNNYTNNYWFSYKDYIDMCVIFSFFCFGVEKQPDAETLGSLQ